MNELYHVDVDRYDQSVHDFLLANGFFESNQKHFAFSDDEFSRLMCTEGKATHFFANQRGHARIFFADKNVALIFLMIFPGKVTGSRLKQIEDEKVRWW